MASLIYERVMKLIDEQKLTRAKVEAGAGLGNGTIESWKDGNPTINKIEAVAGILGVSVEELVRKED